MSETSSKCSDYDDEVFEEDSTAEGNEDCTEGENEDSTEEEEEDTAEEEEESVVHYDSMVSLVPKQKDVVEEESEGSQSISTSSNLTESVHPVLKDLSQDEECSEEDDEEKLGKFEFGINSTTPSTLDPEDYSYNSEYNLFSIYAQTALMNYGKKAKSFSFSNERMREINRHNEILLEKIMTRRPNPSLGSRKSSVPVSKNISPQKRVSSAAINRKKQDIKIARENDILGKKIQAIASRKHSQHR